MQLILLKSKLQSVIVTEANLAYRGSITIDPDLLDAARMYPYESVHVNNANNGARIITYIIPGIRGSGEICLNGAAALHFKAGDKAHILAFGHFNEEEAINFKPIIVHTDENNKIKELGTI